jgi:hypothetical protein
MLKMIPRAFYAYLGVSAVIVVAALFETGGLTINPQPWSFALWAMLLLATAVGLRYGRYALIAWQVLAVWQVWLFSAGHAFDVGWFMLVGLVTLQLALLCTPGFWASRAG